MVYRRKIIDRRTREGKALGQKLDALKGLGILALLGWFLVFGHNHKDASTDVSKDALVGAAQADSLDLASAKPSSMNSASQLQPSGANAWPEMPSVSWRHVTPTGVRWSLRRISSSAMLLIVDLGDGQVANVSVAPAFENLDLPGMNFRVDHVRSEVSQKFPIQTANYVFDRNGDVRQIP